MVKCKCTLCGADIERERILPVMICKECEKTKRNAYRRSHGIGVEAVKKNRINTKLRAIEYLGGKCIFCGYSRCSAAMEFHHKDPSQKDFTIGGPSRKSWDKVQQELDKCILVCSNCHKELHAGLLGPVE